MYCTECGKEVLATAKFCTGCGAKQTVEGVDPAPRKVADSGEKEAANNKAGGLAAAAYSAIRAAKKIGEEINRISEEHGVKEKVINATAAAKAAAADASTSFAEDIKKINDAKTRAIEENNHAAGEAKIVKVKAFGKSFWSELTKRQKIIVALPIILLLTFVFKEIAQEKGGASFEKLGTDMSWYSIQDFTYDCKIDEKGPSGWIQMLQTARQSYKIRNERKVENTAVEVTIELTDMGKTITLYRGRNRCEAAVNKIKGAKNADVDRFK